MGFAIKNDNSARERIVFIVQNTSLEQAGAAGVRSLHG